MRSRSRRAAVGASMNVEPIRRPTDFLPARHRSFLTYAGVITDEQTGQVAVKPFPNSHGRDGTPDNDQRSTVDRGHVGAVPFRPMDTMQQYDIAERDAVRAEQESEARAERDGACPLRTAHLGHGTCPGVTLADHPEQP